MNQNVSMLDNFKKFEVGNFIIAGFFSWRCCDKNQVKFRTTDFPMKEILKLFAARVETYRHPVRLYAIPFVFMRSRSSLCDDTYIPPRNHELPR